MGVLAHPRHETFAQAVASGASIIDAFEKAGYPRRRGNASRLRTNERVSARIAELVAQRTAETQRQALSAAEKAGVDAFWVMRTLRRNSVMAARRGDTAASNRAAELIGKHIGMFIEKKQIEISYIDDADEYLAKILELVGQPVIEHEPLEDAEARREAAYRAANERHPLPISGASHGQEDGSDQQADLMTIDIIEETS